MIQREVCTRTVCLVGVMAVSPLLAPQKKAFEGATLGFQKLCCHFSLDLLKN